MGDRIKPLGNAQLAMLKAGKDPKDIDVLAFKGGKASGQEFSIFCYSFHSYANHICFLFQSFDIILILV
jgi:hypothetical protein